MRNFALFILRVSSQIVVVLGMVVFFYGCYRFYEGPIIAQYGGYYTLGGQPRSFQEYHGFKQWETGICVLWPAMFALCGLRYWRDPKGLAWIWSWERMSQNNLTDQSS